MIKPQHIYKAKNFIFENNRESKPKYFVVFHIDEESILLFSLTTSQSKLPENLDSFDSEGCVFFNDERGYGHTYIIKPHKIIGHNDFCFPIRTYIQLEFRTQLKEVNSEDIIRKYVSQEVIECCEIIDNEFLLLLNCLLRSRFLKNKHRKQIEYKVIKLNSTIDKQ
jgi:hypothetical protein